MKRIVPSKRTEADEIQSSICGLGGLGADDESTSSATSDEKKNFMTHPLVRVLFQKNGGLCEKSYVEDVVYENQARSGITHTFGTAWGLYLDPNGEGPWVSLKSGCVDVEDVKMFMPLNPDAVPKGWKWVDEWQVSCDVPGECDELGWAYGYSFSSIRCIGGSSHVTDTLDKRQRRWIRRRVMISDVQNNAESNLLEEAHSSRVEDPMSRLRHLGRNPFASRFRHVRTQNMRRQRLMSSRFHRRFVRDDEEARKRQHKDKDQSILSKTSTTSKLIEAINNNNDKDFLPTKHITLQEDSNTKTIFSTTLPPSDSESLDSEEESWLEE